MKIAVVTVDGKAISQHFGRSPYYSIVMVENGEIKSQVLRERRTGHFASGGPQHGGDFDERGRHGYGAEARASHATKAQEISDCQVLIAGGMGSGAYENFREAGLEVILSDMHLIDDAVKAYLAGNLRHLVNERTD